MDNGNNVDPIVFNLDDQVRPIYQESTTMDSGVENWVFLALESKRGRAWFFSFQITPSMPPRSEKSHKSKSSYNSSNGALEVAKRDHDSSHSL